MLYLLLITGEWVGFDTINMLVLAPLTCLIPKRNTILKISSKNITQTSSGRLSLPHARLQVRCQISIGVSEFQLSPYIFPMSVNSGLGYCSHLGYFLSAESVPDHVANENLLRGQTMV